MTLTHEPALPTADWQLKLEKQVHFIAGEIREKKAELTEVGLLGGKAGITLLYAWLSKIFPEKKYQEETFDWLDMLGTALSEEELGYNLSGGVAGIAYVFQHLRNAGILNKEEDLNLQELDAFIAQGAEQDHRTGNWDPLHGLTGLGIYFLERHQETGEKKYLEQVVRYLSAMRTPCNGEMVWVTPGYGNYSKDNYNFGTAHGMPGVLAFLAQVHRRGILQEEIEPVISSAMSFLLSHEYADSIYSFPTAIDVLPGGPDAPANSRLGWCYGDLCMAFALIQCGQVMQREAWLNKGIEVALKTTQRTFEDSGCNDAPFCHGSSGLIHLYDRLHRSTGRAEFGSAARRWMDLTLEHYYKAGEGAGGYFFRSFSEEKNIFELTPQYSLLEGSAGIALVYLSYLHGIGPGWDHAFLIHV